jgi:hypothetical protein
MRMTQYPVPYMGDRPLEEWPLSWKLTVTLDAFSPGTIEDVHVILDTIHV